MRREKRKENQRRAVKERGTKIRVEQREGEERKENEKGKMGKRGGSERKT